MKKLMTFAIITTLSLTTVAEAKRGSFKMVRSKPHTSYQHKPDATFNNTPNKNAIPKQATPQPSVNGNRMGSFVTGAAAGYLLSNALSPSEAQAQTSQPAMSSENVPSNSALASTPVNVQRFKQIDPTDPNLIERNANYARYCLGGNQYIISGSKAIPLVDNSNQPQSCIIEQ